MDGGSKNRTTPSLRINRLIIENLRNISRADIRLSPSLNFIEGANGSGKTTILEAVYLLARGKSFRKGHPTTQIKQGKPQLALFSEVETGSGERVRVGLLRRGSTLQMRLNGDPVRRLSDLANNLPVALVTPQTHRILDEGPEYRRKLLNWGMFHVEHSYGNLLSSYNRVLVQRNHALRSKNMSLEIWDRQLVQLSEQISEMQLRYVESWNIQILELASSIDSLIPLKLMLHPGWELDRPLETLLQSKVELDRRQGFTSIGSHRADIQIHIEGTAARNYLSRGQQKLLIIIMMLAQALCMEKRRGVLPLFLIDDLQSELDSASQEKIFDIFKSHPLQTIITGTQPHESVLTEIITGTRMFHVEHGVVTPEG